MRCSWAGSVLLPPEACAAPAAAEGSMPPGAASLLPHPLSATAAARQRSRSCDGGVAPGGTAALRPGCLTACVGCAGGSCGGVGADAASRRTGLALRASGRGAAYRVPNATCGGGGFCRLVEGLPGWAGGGSPARTRPLALPPGCCGPAGAGAGGERPRLRSVLPLAEADAACCTLLRGCLTDAQAAVGAAGGQAAPAAASLASGAAGAGCRRDRGPSRVPAPLCGFSRAAAMRRSTSAVTAAEKDSKLLHSASLSSAAGAAGAAAAALPAGGGASPLPPGCARRLAALRVSSSSASAAV